MCAYPIFCLLCSSSLLFFMSYLISRVLAKSCLILDEMSLMSLMTSFYKEEYESVSNQHEKVPTPWCSAVPVN